MIGQIKLGASFAGALRYDHQKDGAQFLSSNCASTHPDEIAAEMDVVALSNSRCSKSCIHMSLNAPSGEYLSDQQWIKAAEISRRELGLMVNQYSLIRHTDAGHDHVHLTINRIGPDGRAWNPTNDFERVNSAMRIVEKELRLQKMQNYQKQDDGRFSQVKSDLQTSINAARGRGLGGLINEMDGKGYQLIKNRSKTTGRVSGISIKANSDGKTWKASELKKGGWRSIAKEIDVMQQKLPPPQKSPSAFMAKKLMPTPLKIAKIIMKGIEL